MPQTVFDKLFFVVLWWDVIKAGGSRINVIMTLRGAHDVCLLLWMLNSKTACQICRVSTAASADTSLCGMGRSYSLVLLLWCCGL